ncbi:MAG: metallophosphoesterase [bacterium]|nr:metallophosphoesterase [bacterium]
MEIQTNKKSFTAILLIVFLGFIGIYTSRMIDWSLKSKIENTNAANCDSSFFTINNPSGSNFSTSCIQNGSLLYSNENRYTIFQPADSLLNVPYMVTPNVSLKDDANLNWAIILSKKATVYVLTRHIPGINQIPSWVQTTYTRITNDDLSKVNQYFLRKNDQGLIGLYDISKRDFDPGTVSFQSASAGLSTAYSMYFVAANPLSTASPSSSPLPTTTSSPSTGGVIFVGAGDIADSGGGSAKTAAIISNLISQNPSTQVFALGDNSYGSYSTQFNKTWGAFKSRVNPVMGNHDVRADYFSYFGTSFGGSINQLYYSKNIGSWHIIGLDSESVTANANDPQLAWLKNDLTINKNVCTLAMWHEPTFSTGAHQDGAKMIPYWEALYTSGAEMVLQSHTHIYERTKPLNVSGLIDSTPSKGMVSFVSGTGGNKGVEFNSDSVCTAGSICAIRHSNSSGFDGVLKITLNSNNYNYEFLHVAGTSATNASFSDKGHTACH